MYTNIFCKDNGEFRRFWLSVSTEKYDSKKKRPTGEYAQATIPARLSEKAAACFEKHSKKTKSKGVSWGRFESEDFWLEAVEPKEGEPYVRVFVLDMEAAEDSE